MTSTERDPAWSERLNPRNWSLAAKLVAVGLVPTLLALVLGVLRISGQAGVAEQLGRDNHLLEIRQDVAATAQALQAERNGAVLFVAGGRKGDRGALAAAAAATDAKLGEVRSALADPSLLDASGTTALQQAEGGFTQLPVLRTDVAGSPAGVDDVTTRYTTIVQRTNVLERALVRQGETTYAGGLGDALVATGQAREALALQHTVLAGAISAGRLSEQDKSAVTGASAAFAAAFADYQVGLTPEEFARYGNFATDGANVELERLRTQIMATPTDRPLQADPAAWDAAYQQAAQVVDRAGSGVADELSATSSQAQADASNKAGVNSVLLMLGVLLGIAIIVLLARSLIRSLRVLRRSALEVAERRLPQAVESMRSGQPLNALVEPVPLAGRDEVGQVARAFDAVHGQAIRLAADQAALQSNVSNMFVNLSRRSQALVERQLQLIEQLESNEQDPDQLSNLFQLDHLATRMRRNSENLLVLAGTDLAKRNVAPVPVVDVLRAAVSEIEQYQRVVVQPPPVATVAGRAASDLVHLLAELLDNATNFSPPDSQVVMSTTRAGDGSLLVEIADRGVGMAEHELAEANQRLSSPTAVDVSASRRMGLFVVGRLANRHGLGIRLGGGMTGGSGGLTASVTVPATLVPTAEPIDRQQPARAGVAPAVPAGQGASAFGGSPAAPAPGTVPAPRPGSNGSGQPRSLSSLVAGDDGPMNPAPALGSGRPPSPPLNGKGLPQRRPGGVPPRDGSGPDDGFDAFGTGATPPAGRRDEAETPESTSETTAPSDAPTRETGQDGSAPTDGRNPEGPAGRQALGARSAGPERGPWPVESLRRPPNGSAVPTRPTNGHALHGERPAASGPGDPTAPPKRTPRGGTSGEATDRTRQQERPADLPAGEEPSRGEARREGQDDAPSTGSERPGEKLGRGVAAAGAALAGAAAGLAGAAGLRKSDKDSEDHRAGSDSDDRTPPAGSASTDDTTPATGTSAAAGARDADDADDDAPRPDAAIAKADAPAVTETDTDGDGDADAPATSRFPVVGTDGPRPGAFSPTADAATTVPSAGAPEATRTTGTDAPRGGTAASAGAHGQGSAATGSARAGAEAATSDTKADGRSEDAAASATSGPEATRTGLTATGTDDSVESRGPAPSASGTDTAKGTEESGTQETGTGESSTSDGAARTGAAFAAGSAAFAGIGGIRSGRTDEPGKGTRPEGASDEPAADAETATGTPDTGAASSADTSADERTDSATETAAAEPATDASGADSDSGTSAASGRPTGGAIPPTAAGLPRRTPGVSGEQRPTRPPSALPRRDEEPEARPGHRAAAASRGATEGSELPRRTPNGERPGQPPAAGLDGSQGLPRRTPGTPGPTSNGDRPGQAPAAGVEGSQGLPRRTPGTPGPTSNGDRPGQAPATGVEGSQGLPRRTPGTAPGRPTSYPTGPGGLPQRRPARPTSASSEGTEALFSASTPADSSSTGQLRRPGGFESRTPLTRQSGINGVPKSNRTPGRNETAPTDADTASGAVTPGVEQTGGTPAAPAAGTTGQGPAVQDPAQGRATQSPTGTTAQGPTPQGPASPAAPYPAGPYRNGGAIAYGTGTPGAPGVPPDSASGLPIRRPSPGPNVGGANGTGTDRTSTNGTGQNGTGGTGPAGNGNGSNPTGTGPGTPAAQGPAAPLGAAPADPTAPAGGPDESAEGPSRFDLGQTTPIFEEIASAWFRSNRDVPVRWTDGEGAADARGTSGGSAGDPLRSTERPAGGNSGFATAADEGWRVADATAAATAAESERGASETTEAGLPKRRPRARLVPGSAAGSAVLAPPSGPARNAEAIRGRLASYQQGVRQGRESRLRRQSAVGGTGTGQTRSTTEQDEEK
ncbi:nitrate- and nitrite sensing domain-containing protein [Pseudonocardia sp. RS11V-5]|uniref:nitrate- and nitrite sensing domain-containing protein n=1 Tax=Pseudonocardia terrae TaxID=2905831 RepID=UPI001E5C1557|nr:nitrate- and nitrite sensing domain-containing protein [Pseudonocardia terrae]MCE3550565.1 nitrate- and nitrite sensing domain-containing protein [Pseudonocardia terrae]